MPTSEDTPSVKIPTALNAKLKNAREMVKHWTEVKAEAEAEVKELLGDHESGTLRGVEVVTWKHGKTNRLNQAALKKDHPDLVAEYTDLEVTRTFKYTG